jgi:hypothetical protein
MTSLEKVTYFFFLLAAFFFAAFLAGFFFLAGIETSFWSLFGASVAMCSLFPSGQPPQPPTTRIRRDYNEVIAFLSTEECHFRKNFLKRIGAGFPAESGL